ncbi:MAG: hypothetical protein V1876_02365 [Candidatus Peregrinibacteria bacterium]
MNHPDLSASVEAYRESVRPHLVHSKTAAEITRDSTRMVADAILQARLLWDALTRARGEIKRLRATVERLRAERDQLRVTVELTREVAGWRELPKETGD